MIFKVAMLAILRNKMRAFLTCIGIIVGIAAVIAVLAIGQGAQKMMVQQISSMGTNLMMVFPERHRHGEVRSSLGSGQTLTAEDARAIEKELSHLVRAVSPIVNVSAQIIRENRNCNSRISGVSASFADIRNWNVAEGRFLSDEDVRNSARVCVIGNTVRKNIFSDDEDPVGKVIRLGAMPFRVVGLLEIKGASSFGQDQDDTVMVPHTTASRVLQGSKFKSIGQVNVSFVDADAAEETRREIAALLRQRHGLADYQDDDFEMRDTSEIMSTIGSVTGLMTVLLTAVAAISLFVGGIGIMNIMLVSVTERIREIGLRMAIGATPANILWQFILEAMALSTVGGAIGVAVGIFTANLIGEVNRWPIVIEASSAVYAFLFSAFVGMFFGFYPAYRASKLNPIDCLRYE